MAMVSVVAVQHHACYTRPQMATTAVAVSNASERVCSNTCVAYPTSMWHARAGTSFVLLPAICIAP